MKWQETWARAGAGFSERLAEAVMARPVVSIVASLLLTLIAGLGLAGYHYSKDHRVFFDAHNPLLVGFEKLQADYSRTDTVLVAVAPKSGNVFDPAFLASLQELTAKSWKVPFVQRVESLTNFQRVQVEGDSIATGDMVPAATQLNAEALADIRTAALAEPFLVDALVNREGSVTALRLTLNLPNKDPVTEVPAVVNALRALADEVRTAQPGTTVHLAGQTIANQAFPEESQADFVRVWPWFTLTMMVLLVYLFRSVKAMLVMFAACELAVVGGAGLIGFFGPTINDSVIVSPVMILSMAFADGIHIVVNWIQSLQAGRDKRAAMVESLKANIGPMTVTTLMTAIGFLTLHFSDSPPFRVMGYIVAAGVVFVLFLTIFFTAPLLAVLPGKAPQKLPALMREDSPFMERLAGFVIRRRYVVLAGVLAVAALFISLVPRNVINDDIVKYYTPGTTFRQDMEFVNENLTGIGELNYSLDAGGADRIADPAYLKQVEAFAQWLKAQPEVTQVNSVTDIVKRASQVMHGDDPAFYRIPDSREEIAQYLLQYEMSLPYGMDLSYLLRFDRSASRVRVAVATSSGQVLIGLNERAEAWLRANTPAPMQEAKGASLYLMFAHIGERSITGMLGGMLGSLALEALFVMVVFGAWRLGVASFTGNLVPIAMAFGAWGALNGNIDLGLTLVLGIAFSVVVDDTIHFVSKYEYARKRLGLDPEAAIRHSFRHVGVAIVTTTLVLGLGFAWLANSALQITVNTAVVTVITIVFALFIDLFLLPVLFLLIDRRQLPAPASEEGAEVLPEPELPA